MTGGGGRLHPYWFMALDRAWPWSRVWLGLLLFVLIGGALSLLLDIWSVAARDLEWQTRMGLCLFFGFINAYSLTMTAAVIRRMQIALDGLRPELSLSADEFSACRSSLAGATATRLVTISLVSLGVGFAHDLLLTDRTDITLSGAPQAAAILAGTVLTWVVMLHCITALVRAAHLFARLGAQHVTVDVLRPAQLTAFGTAAWLPAAALMGTQVAYPLLFLGGFNPWASLPGFGLTLVTIVYLLVKPMWSVHLQLREAKAVLLANTDEQLRIWRTQYPQATLPDEAFIKLEHATSTPGPDSRTTTPDPEALRAFDAVARLLFFRQQVGSLPEWPFNLSLAVRWVIYVVIPPVTWVLAALMENLVDDWTS